MSNEILVNKITNFENFREAEDALLSLKKTEPEKAFELALDILNHKHGDEFFQACAFEVLYSTNRKRTLSMLDDLLTSMSVEVFRAVIESVTEDSELVEEEPQILSAVQLVKTKISTLASDELKTLESSIAWFTESFNL